MRPFFVAGVQRALDQQPAKARAIDEQVGIVGQAIFERDAGDKAACPIELDRGDLAFDALYMPRFGIFAEERRIEPGVEMIGIVEGGEHAARILRGIVKLPRRRRLPGHANIIEAGFAAGQPRGDPVLVDIGDVVWSAKAAERVEIAMAKLGPIDKLDAELERALRGFDEFVFIDAERAVEHPYRRDRRLAHANGADFLRLDQCDLAAMLKRVRQDSSRHPTGRAATDDHDLADLAVTGVQVRSFPCCGTCWSLAQSKAGRKLPSTPPILRPELSR